MGRRALTTKGLLNKKFKYVLFRDEWAGLIGRRVELRGTWIIFGESGNGKTRFSLALAKYLMGYEKVLYNSMEEGASLTMQKAVKDLEFPLDSRSFLITDNEDLEEMKKRLKKKRPPRIIILDSLQYSMMSKEEYKELKEKHRNKLFIFISHAEGNKPLGSVAEFIQYDSHVKIRVEGYKAFAKSRYGGATPYTIWEKGAKKYYEKK